MRLSRRWPWLTRAHILPADALELYTQALQQSTPLEGVSSTAAAGNTANSSEVAALHSNIAAVLLKLDRPEQALQHATAATQVRQLRPLLLYACSWQLHTAAHWQ